MQRVTVDDWLKLAEMIWATNEANGWDVAIAADWDTNKRKLASPLSQRPSRQAELNFTANAHPSPPLGSEVVPLVTHS